METRTVNIDMLNGWISKAGKRGPAKLSFAADVSLTTVRETLKGNVPGELSRIKLSRALMVNENDLFPLIAEEDKAA